jgi:hypothetical protein
MTLRQFLNMAASHPTLVAVLLLLAPSAAALLALLVRGEAGRRPPFRYFYAALVYVATLPGMFAAVVSAYRLVFGGENLLDLELVSSGLPIACMLLTLFLISKAVDLDALPGFDRLAGFMFLVGLAFATALILARTRIWLVFGGSILHFLGLFVAIFVLLRWAAARAFGARRRSREP